MSFTSQTNDASNKQAIKIIASVFSGDGKVGDFGWMITQPEYAKTFFIFNDNVSQFKIHQDHPNDPSGCSIGGGNAIIDRINVKHHHKQEEYQQVLVL
ncbi:MAG: hypothetical protein KBT89_16275 [Gammaproteobacteria bacterium]|nr:hypothetical protein [Gammaproteobacteria bacterium]